MEKHRVPTVFLATSQFGRNARLSSEDNGVPHLRIVPVPADKYYSERISVARATPVAASVLGAIVEGLTKPLAPEELRVETKARPQPNLAVTGDTVESLMENFNRLFLENHWSDGLPIVPPTPSNVRWMLSGTTRDPKEVLGSVPPRNGVATIQNVAINAVMAGALPEHLPVIIAAMEAITDGRFDDQHFLTSSGSFNIVITVSGPIVRQLGMNSGIGYLSFGSRANAAIGRAVRLSLTNQGHLWPAENDMALVGRAGAFTFLVVPENQDDSPWEPYHVSQGFKATDSCVTVDVIGGYVTGQTQPRVYGGGAVRMVSAETITKQLIGEMRAPRDVEPEIGSGIAATVARQGSTLAATQQRYLFVLPPETAQEMHSMLGYSRDSLRQYLYDQASEPYEKLQPADIAYVKKAIESGAIPKERAAAFEAGLTPGGKVPLLQSPGDINIIVAGGYPGYTLAMTGYLKGPFNPIVHSTKVIRGAASVRTSAAVSVP